MKKLTFFIFGILFFINTNAQTLVDSTLYNKGLNMINSAKTVQDFKAAGNYFIELSEIKQDEWLAPLYVGLSYVLASFIAPDKNIIDEFCDTAQMYIDIASKRNADVSELASLQAFLYQTRIEVSPIERGISYSMKAESQIKKAEAANPRDPRPYFLYAMNVYYTPKAIGGGAEKALPLFENAAEKFKEYTPQMPFMPTWGKQQNLEMIKKCKNVLSQE